MNEKLIMESIQSRIDIGTWFRERPNVGLDITDIAKLCDGYDYLFELLFGGTHSQLTIGENNEDSEICR